MTKGIDFADAAQSALDEAATSDPTIAEVEKPEGNVLDFDHPEDDGALSALTNADTESADHPEAESVIEVDGEQYSPSEIRRLRDKAKNLEADYTKKTQSLAEERQQMSDALALWEQLETDPLGTVRKLHQRFSQFGGAPNGLDNFQTKPQQLPAVSQDEQIAKLVDERVQEILNSDPRIKEVESRQAQEQLETVWAEIESEYEVSLTDQDKYMVLQKAEELGVYDLSFVFGGLLRQAEQVRKQRENLRAVSNSGGSRSTSVGEPSVSAEVFDFKGAAQAALAELGDNI